VSRQVERIGRFKGAKKLKDVPDELAYREGRSVQKRKQVKRRAEATRSMGIPQSKDEKDRYRTMVVVINDDRITDVEAYLPLAKAFAADAVANDKGCRSMEVLTDPAVPGRVVYISHFDSEEDFKNHAAGETFKKHVVGMAKYFVSASDTILNVE